MEPLAQPIRTAAVIPIEDSSQIPVARRAALEAGRSLQLDDETLARAEIVAVELARNILLHGRTVTSESGVPTRRIQRPGELFVSSTLLGGGIQIVAVDSGKGIPSVAQAMADGFSTAGTPGHGLGSVKRLSRSFDLYSAIEPAAARGTVVSAVVGPEAAASPAWDGNAAVLSTALPNETVNGDSWAAIERNGSMYFLVVDGLGHGMYAHEAANVAMKFFLRFVQSRPSGETISPAEVVTHLHGPMHATRGAALAVVRVESERRLATFCGVGNLSALLRAPSGETRGMISHNGTVGHQMQKVQEFVHAWQPGSLLILHSDGIHTSWRLENTPGLARQASATIAGAIYREAWRGRDDATVLVARLV
jgi:anti-sigma regulatory factor (Ser/Thr protein kinase)